MLGLMLWKNSNLFVDFNSKKKQQKKLSMDQWKYLIKDKFPKYITWEIFENIQNILKDNYAEYDEIKHEGFLVKEKPYSRNHVLRDLRTQIVCTV